MQDLELINRCIQKEPLAWNEFVKKYSSLILIAAENRLKKYGFFLSYQEIEDIRQNVLTSLWRDNKLQTVKNRKDISYWLAIVSGNEAISYVRRLGKQGALRSESLFEKIDEAELIEIIPSDKSHPNEEAARNEISKKIEDAIESLPHKEKLTIKLNILYGKKYYEISDILALPKGTVSNYIKRAKEKLRVVLKDFK